MTSAPAGRASGPSGRLPRELRVLVGAAFLVAVGYGLVAPALPVFARTFDVDVTAASALVSIFAVARIICAPISGRAVGCRGEVPVFCTGLAIVAVSSAACAFATGYPQLLLFRAAGGLGSTMFTVSAAALLLRLAPPDLRGRASAAWSTGFLSGNVAGPAIGGWLMSGDIRTPFLGYAGILLVTAAITGYALRGRRDLRTSRIGGNVPAVTFTDSVRHPAYRAALVANFLNGWTVYGVRIALTPIFVVDVLHQSNGWSGGVLTAFAAGTAATLLIGGRLSDRIGRRLPIIIGSATVALTSLCLGLSGSIAALLAIALLSGSGTGLMTPPVNAAVGDVIAGNGRDAHGGTALAAFQMIGDIGSVVGPVISGAIADRAGFTAAFSTCTIVAALSLFAWLRAPETRPR